MSKLGNTGLYNPLPHRNIGSYNPLSHGNTGSYNPLPHRTIGSYNRLPHGRFQVIKKGVEFFNKMDLSF